jgi:2-oxoisovalerate dehydrogenase E2 component (dihydrolipoyl transacylase)
MNTKRFSSYSSSNDTDNDPTMENNDGGSNNNNNTTIPFVLADIGEGIAEVELLQWFVSPGDKINQFDRVCEVQSDKASVEITSRYDGVVSLLCGNVGDVMRVGQPLLYITPTGTNADSNNASSSSGTTLPVMQQSSTSTLPKMNNVDDVQDRLSIPLVGAKYTIGSDNGYDTTVSPAAMTNSNPLSKVLTSPSVRKLGKENNINLANVIGTGPDGRILKSDLLRIIDPASTTPALPIIPSLYPTTTSSTFPSSSSPKSTTEAATTATGAATSSERKEEFDDDDKVIPIRGYHRLMVKSMTSSLQVPHMIYADEININSLIAARNTLRQSMLLLEGGGVKKVSYMPFFIKATSLALYKYPILNSTINVDQMTVTHHTSHNIGIAVDTPKGLVVPVITNCQCKSIIDITMELHHLLALANEGNLTEKEISNATFTLSNIGSIGGTYMSPIIVPPQVAIGAFGKISRVPRFINDDNTSDDTVESVHIMPISWGGDHRVVDGATMARFSNVFKLYIENPVSMMFDMR